jgi:hypothetical protein
MSLENKLSKISNEIRENKENESKKLQEEKLEPIRLNIKELEKTKFQLELILNSLKLKSEKDSGIGMREYSTKTENEFKKENTQLDKLIDKNQEALKTIGVENKDQLLENSDFSGDEEIISYKKSKAEKEDLELSDSALKERLLSLGIIIDQEKFSYDLAEKTLEEKIEQTSKELALEKAKTPEGKEELKKELIQYFNKEIPSFSFSKAKNFDHYNKNYVLDLGGYNRIEFDENRIIRGDTPGSFSMGEWEKLEEKYPYDVIREAMKEAFEKKVGSSSYSYDLSGSHDRETKELKEYKEMIQSKFLPMAKNMIDIRFRNNELRYKAKIQGLGNNIGSIKDVENIIKNLESYKKEAERILKEITRIEIELPNEEVILSGTYIEVPSALKEYNEFIKETDEKTKRLKDVLWEIQKLETNKPKFFGKEKWNSSFDELTQEKGELEKRTDSKWTQEENNKLYKKAYFYIPTKEYSDVEKIVKEQPKIKGNSKEIFNDLKVKLNDIANKEIPESALKLYEEFGDLVENK